MTAIVDTHLRFEALFSKKRRHRPRLLPTCFPRFIPNLREALLDQPAYSELVPKETLNTLREILTEMRPNPYDDETLYRQQIAHTYRDLQMFGLPKDEYDPPRIDAIFIKARANRKLEPTASDPAQPTKNQEERPPQSVPVSFADLVGAPAAASSSAIPGSGKTTLLRFLAYICSVRNSAARSQPRNRQRHSAPTIYVSLPGYVAQAEKQGNAYGLLALRVRGSHGNPWPQSLPQLLPVRAKSRPVYHPVR